MRLNAILRFVVASLLLPITISGCGGKKTPAPEKKDVKPSSTASRDHFDGGTYCVQNLMQGPAPAHPLHFSYKVTESDPSQKAKDYEADLDGDTMDLTYHERWLATEDDKAMIREEMRFNDPKSVMRTLTPDGYADTILINHYTRSDESGWRMAATSIAQGGTPWNLFISKPTVNRIGTEGANGYDTLKYAVDTTHDSQMDKAALLMFAGLKDYNITGTAWVLKDAGCVLQYNLDYEQQSKDGKNTKTHYEGAVTSH